MQRNIQTFLTEAALRPPFLGELPRLPEAPRVRHTEGVERLTAAIAGLLKELGRKDAEAMAFLRPAALPFPKCACQFFIQQNRSRFRLDFEATFFAESQ
jgi:hypothetical protein